MATATLPSPSATDTKGLVRWMIVITATLAALLEVIDTSIVNVALADMQSTFGATLSEIGWVVTSYAMANVVMIPLSAWLGDYFGRKRYFVFALVGFTVSSVMCAFAPSLGLLIAGRVIQGLLGGGLLARAQSLIFESFPPNEQGKASAIFGIGVIVGPALGPTLGGYLTTNYSWPTIFLVNIPFGIAAVFLAVTYIKPDPLKRTVSSKVDFLGIFLLVVGLVSLQYMLEEGNSDDWFESNLILTLAFTSVIGIALFIWRELATPHPAVDLRVLRHKSLAAGSVFSAILGMGLYGAVFAIPIFTQTVLGYTSEQTGFILLPGALASGMIFPFLGRVIGKIDARWIIIAGTTIFVTSMLLLSTLSPQTGTDQLFIPMVLRGLGIGCIFLPLTVATLGALPKQDIPAASGFFNLSRQIGGGVGIAILTTFLSQRYAFHRHVLAENMSASNPTFVRALHGVQLGLRSRWANPSRIPGQSLKVMDGILNQQANVMSFADTFWLVGAIFVFAVPLIFLLGKGRGGTKVEAGH